jgi:DnaD/phage-associated family protein
MIKASFWSDPDILQWPREKRWFYEGLVQLADDSGCLEDSAFAFKLHLFPSPVDADITIDVINTWIGELVTEEKAQKYESCGKKCLYLVRFHRHQALRNPGAPEVPLPQWVTYCPAVGKGVARYIISDSYDADTNPVPTSYASQREGEREENLISSSSTAHEESTEANQADDVDKPSTSNDDYTAEIVNYYQQNWALPMGQTQRDMIFAWIDQDGMDPPVILEALKQCIIAGVRDLRYFGRIMSNLKAEGITTLEGWRLKEKRREIERSEQSAANRQPPKRGAPSKVRASSSSLAQDAMRKWAAAGEDELQ